MNIITCKACNVIMVEGLESTGRNLVPIARDVYVFVRSFTYSTNFVVLEDIEEFVVSDMTDIIMGRLMSTWMTFGGNTRDLGSFREETDGITTIHKIQRKKCAQWLEMALEILVTLSKHTSDDVRLFKTVSERNRLNEAIKDSVKRRRQDYKATRTSDQAFSGKLHDKNGQESRALLEDLALYDNEIQCLMEAHLAPKLPVKLNKSTSSCEICSGPHDTQYCMENSEQAFLDYAFSHFDEAGGKWFTFKLEQNNISDTYNPS
ncbi:hypothetical protein Tco_0581016 [Tanacetum coccineum]